MLPVQVQRVPLKSPEGTTIPARKAMHPRPVLPIMKNWIHEPQPQHTRTEALSQLVTQEHRDHLYHPVIIQHETYDKLNIRHPNLYISSTSNELGRLASGVGDRMTSRTDPIFLFTRIKSQQVGRQNIPIHSAIT